MTAEERAKTILDVWVETFGGDIEAPSDEGFAAVTESDITNLESTIAASILAAQREAEVGMRERCRIVAWDHECDKRCKDEGLGPMCQFTIAEDIAILPSEYGEESCTST